MTNEQFKDILKYINTLIEVSSASDDTDNEVEALDQIRDLIKLYLNIMEEE